MSQIFYFELQCNLNCSIIKKNFIQKLKKILLATLSLLGIVSSQSVNATSYTHTLNYTAQDEGTLTGRVTFEDTDANASTDQGSVFSAASLDTSLITNVTFTYVISGTSYTLSSSDISHFVIDHKASTDYSSNLYSQLNNIQFLSTGAAFELGNNNANFSQNADVSGSADDFLLSSSTYHSPGPLPLLGLFTAFSSLKKLKSKYKKKYSL